MPATKHKVSQNDMKYVPSKYPDKPSVKKPDAVINYIQNI